MPVWGPATATGLPRTRLRMAQGNTGSPGTNSVLRSPVVASKRHKIATQSLCRPILSVAQRLTSLGSQMHTMHWGASVRLAGPELPPLHNQRACRVHALGKALGCSCQHPKSNLDNRSKLAELALIGRAGSLLGLITLGPHAGWLAKTGDSSKFMESSMSLGALKTFRLI